MFEKIKQIALNSKGDDGLEALWVLVEFRQLNGSIPDELVDAFLTIAWKSYTPGPPSSIAQAEADLEAIRRMRRDLRVDQKKIIGRMHHYLGTSTAKQFLASIKTDEPLGKMRPVDEIRRGDLTRYLLGEFLVDG